MKHFYLIFILLFYFKSQAQLSISATTSATALSQTISGQGVTILNPTLTCAANQAGIFTGGTASGLGLNSGIILTSGQANGILPPNSTSSPGNGATILPLLSQLAAQNGGSTNMFDGCVLSFDVIPTCDSLAIRYIFASTEFPTFVNTIFNDVFGFFVSGPNPSGGNYNNVNIATIPGTNTPITITTVGIVPGAFQTITGLQGNYFFTTNYLAAINVVPNQVYTFVLAIADAGDGSLDSSVLLDFEGLYCINPLNISANQQNICLGDSVILTASGGGVTTNWNIPGNSVQINPNQYKVFPTTTTTYSISSLTQWGLFTDSVTVTVTPQPNVNILASKDSICRGEALPLQVTGASNYIWTPANVLTSTTASNVLASPQNNTLIYVQGNNGNCVDYDTLLIKVKQLPQTMITMPDFKICYGDTAYIWGVSQHNDLFSWTPNQNINLHSTGFINQANNIRYDSVMVNPTSTTYYKLNGSNYCANSYDSVLVRVIPPINLQINNSDPSVCVGETITLIATGADEFTWSPNFGLNSNSNDTVQITLTKNQTYTLTGIIDFCSDSILIPVRINPKPAIEINEKNPKICDGKSITIQILGADSVYFQPNAQISNISKLGALFSPTISSIFPFSAYNTFGCKTDSIVKIEVFPPITFKMPKDTFVCENHFTMPYTIWPKGGNGTAFQYHWLNAQNDIIQNDSLIIFSPLQTKYYVLSVTDHCESQPKIDSILIEVKNKPKVNFTHDIMVCEGEEVNFSNLSDNNHYVLWDFGNGSYSNEKANSFSYRYPLAGTYKPILNIINEFGCENKFDSLTIDVSTKPKANFYLDPEKVDLLNPTIYFNDLSSKDVVSWQWLINGKLHSTEINTERTFKDTGIVSIVLIVENKNGCLDTAYSQATVKDVERIWIPNAFTPNSDGINDAFFPVGNVIFDGNFELKIYDRFGAEIFSSNSIDKKWNGAFQNEGEILPFGVYVYQLNYFDEARHLKTLKGHLTLQK